MENQKTKIKKPFLPLDLEFHNDIKFREAAYLASQDGINLPIMYFIHIFEYYCLVAKKERKNLDIRCISKFSLVETTGLNLEQIESINQYLIKTKLLTKKYTITNYYKWNLRDEEITFESESVRNQKVSGSVSDEVRSQSEVSQNQSAIKSESESARLKKKISDRKSVLKTRYSMSEYQILSDKILVSLNNQLSELISQKSASQSEVSESEIESEKISESEMPIRPPLENRDKSIEIRDINKENILTNVKENSQNSEIQVFEENQVSEFLKAEVIYVSQLEAMKSKNSKRFVKPTIEEISEYCQQRANGIDPEAFYAHYQSKGWKVGNAPMKDWKASIITWEKRQKQNNTFSNNNLLIYENQAVQNHSKDIRYNQFGTYQKPRIVQKLYEADFDGAADYKAAVAAGRI